MKMEEKQIDYLFDLFEKVSIRLNKPLDEMKSFYHILKDNWYDNQQALTQVSDQQYTRLKIPARLFNAIKEELNAKNIKSVNEPYFNQTINNSKNISLSPQNIPSMNEFTMMQYSNQLQHDLKNKYKYDPNQVSEIFQTLYKVIHNIVQDPYEIKFRTLKKTNGMIQRIVSNNPSVVKFLALFGFEEDSQKYVLSAPKTQELIFIQEVILEKSQSLKRDNFQPFLGDVKMPEKPLDLPESENKMGNKSNYSNMPSSIQEEFSKQKLAQMKYVDALDKLIEFRHKIMSQPPKDRKLRIYHKRHETKTINEQNQVNMKQEFQKSEDKIIQGYWAQIMNENRKNSGFQSKRKQEFEFLIRQKIHKETIIKVKLPNQYIIEARFGPLQKLKDVFTLAVSIVIGDVYLFHAPPVKKLDKNLQKTLFELDSVPMGSFYLGTNSQWYIQNEFSKIIQK